MTPPTRMIVNFLNQKIPAYLDCCLNLVDVRDVAEGHILAAQRGRSGERYLLGHENMKLSQLLCMLEDITGLAMPKNKVPYWLALMVGVRLAGRGNCFNSDKAVHELGFRQSSIRQALVDEIVWLAETRQINLPVSLIRKTF
ncbi:hypothetical protein [uncultured Nitrosomonas sp.]|uniref:hypothetical protein n=1 Tax=uncultured Nitrosomonas sp. TaxID=156424 RepID=UPI002620F4F5|nr:hypothetical protein [uncultured Nitrosomonas sp.]